MHEQEKGKRMKKLSFTIPAKHSSTGKDRIVVMREALRRDQKIILAQKRNINHQNLGDSIEFMEAMLSLAIQEVDGEKFDSSNPLALDKTFNACECQLLQIAYDRMNGVPEEAIENFLNNAVEVIEETPSKLRSKEE